MSKQANHIEEKSIVRLGGRLQMPPARSAREVWPQLSSRLVHQSRVVKLNTWLRVAASVSLLIIFGYRLYLTQSVEISTARATRSEVLLPDGSKVWLNAQSSVEYNRISWWMERSLRFEGEGFFQVEKGSEFSVHSTSGTTRVLGTSFNIYARHDQYKVSCTTGKVHVKFANSQSQYLTPGLQATNTARISIPRKFEKAKTLAWQKGEFYFDSATLHEVFETIEIQYNVTLIHEGIDLERRYTGFFTNRDIDETLKVVCLPMGLSYKLIDTQNIKIFKEHNV